MSLVSKLDDHLEDMYTFLDTYSLLRLNYEEIGNPNKPIRSKVRESIVKKISTKNKTKQNKKKGQDLMASLLNSTKQ
jgi:FtsZ-binding cell division protein ZapB